MIPTNLQELVKKPKYDTQLDLLFEQTKQKLTQQQFLYEQKRIIPEPNEQERLYMIAALAVTDQKNGQEPTSSNPWYLKVYRAAQEV